MKSREAGEPVCRGRWNGLHLSVAVQYRWNELDRLYRGSAKSANYSFQMKAELAGKYHCVVKNASGEVTSEAADVTVAASGEDGKMTVEMVETRVEILAVIVPMIMLM